MLFKHNVCEFDHYTNTYLTNSFACHNQKMFLKRFKNVDKQNEAKRSHEEMHFVMAKCTSMFDKQIRNVCQTMSACLSRALQKTQGSCIADLVRLSDENKSS